MRSSATVACSPLSFRNMRVAIAATLQQGPLYRRNMPQPHAGALSDASRHAACRGARLHQAVGKGGQVAARAQDAVQQHARGRRAPIRAHLAPAHLRTTHPAFTCASRAKRWCDEKAAQHLAAVLTMQLPRSRRPPFARTSPPLVHHAIAPLRPSTSMPIRKRRTHQGALHHFVRHVRRIQLRRLDARRGHSPRQATLHCGRCHGRRLKQASRGGGHMERGATASSMQRRPCCYLPLPHSAPPIRTANFPTLVRTRHSTERTSKACRFT